MQDTLVIEITNPKAKDLLTHLEDLHWIKVLKRESKESHIHTKKKFRGILSKKQGVDLNEHIQTSRIEWGDT